MSVDLRRAVRSLATLVSFSYNLKNDWRERERETFTRQVSRGGFIGGRDWIGEERGSKVCLPLWGSWERERRTDEALFLKGAWCMCTDYIVTVEPWTGQVSA